MPLLLVVAACATAPVAAGGDPTELAVPGGAQQVWCDGQGPTAILLNGIGDGAQSEQWLEVQRRLSDDATVCRYDRPGTGASGPPTTPGRGPDALVAELEAVVDHATGDGPVILVAHSFGGYLARLYAQHHPYRVRGIVFVDALDPSVGLARGTGAGRLDAIGMADEQLDLAAIEAAAAAVTTLPGDPPVIVLSRGRGTSTAWTAGQQRLSALSANTSTEVVPGAGHQIPTDAPQAIIDAARALQHAEG